MANIDNLKMAIYYHINQVMVITFCLILFCTASWRSWKRRTRTCRQRSRGWNRKLRICDCLKVKAWTFELSRAKFLDICFVGVYVCIWHLSHVMCSRGQAPRLPEFLPGFPQCSDLRPGSVWCRYFKTVACGFILKWNCSKSYYITLILSVCFFICYSHNIDFIEIYVSSCILFTWFSVD